LRYSRPSQFGSTNRIFNGRLIFNDFKGAGGGS
jgi:hypothetical protein